ncbi:helix-turn-helix domain-containing protein [Zhongshania sp.]|uniref:AraC family transcriptional regulator n=1 Tax=Zhongshania sp. TaxID=1971902 RepID=UPI003568A0BB
MPSLATFAQFGAMQGVVLAFAILTMHYGHRIANRILALFLVVQSARLYALSFNYSASSADGQLIFQLLHLSYTYGPLVYIYTRLLTQASYRLRATALWHFTPALFGVFLFWPGGLILDGDLSQYQRFEDLPIQQQSLASYASVPVYLSLFVYSCLSWRLLQSHRLRIREQFSALELINLNWLRALIAICVVTAAISGTIELLRGLTAWNLGPRVASSALLSVLLILYIGIMGLRQPAIFDQGQRSHARTDLLPKALQAGGPSPTLVDTKYEKSALKEAHIEQLWQKLEQCMREKRRYLEPSIKLAELAEEIATLPNYLSQTINRRSGKNFFEYINSYRLEEACRLLEHAPELTIGDIALRSGFNSQNVLNGHFKKRFNKTPSQYRKQSKSIS